MTQEYKTPFSQKYMSVNDFLDLLTLGNYTYDSKFEVIEKTHKFTSKYLSLSISKNNENHKCNIKMIVDKNQVVHLSQESIKYALKKFEPKITFEQLGQALRKNIPRDSSLDDDTEEIEITM